jgi:HPt (histidine-containing phosphotransfer) domain-containing protein
MELSEHDREVMAHQVGADRDGAIGTLSDSELAEELLVAAMARARRRLERFNELLAERDRRTPAH